MNILILGSVALPVPPPLQGGTERIAWYQAKGLAGRGHAVTLVAAHGSLHHPSYTLVEIGWGDTVAGASREIVESSRNLRKEAVYLSQVAQYLLDHGRDYDIVLNNMRAGEAYFLPIAKTIGVPFTTVMHLPIFSELADLFRMYHTPVITISNAQRREFPDLNYVGTVYNGMEIEEYQGDKGNTGNRGEYLLMMGSIAPHKNQKAGIAVARALEMKLVIAGKIGNKAYYDAEVAPHVDGKMVRLVGEIGMEEKVKLYAGARALLFPILWEEPFGLVMIEAMACGTPVVAYRRGAVPEIVKDGVTGFIVSPDVGDLGNVGHVGFMEAVRCIGEIDRAACRRHVAEHFTIEKMVDALEHALRSL